MPIIPAISILFNLNQSEASKLALVGLNFIVLTAELFLFCTTGTMVLSAVIHSN